MKTINLNRTLGLGTLLFAATLFMVPLNAQAKLSVLTTVTDLRALVSEIGGDQVDVSAIAKGTQDPHYIEAKPSYMTKASRADLVVCIGLELEIGYLPPILQGARNPKVMPGNRGYLEVGPLIQPIEIPTSKITRAEGDVHPSGNPHFSLDPIRMGEAAIRIAERMGSLDTAHAAQFMEKAKAIQNRFQSKTKGWQERIKKSGVKEVVTYHKTLNYFFDRFHLVNAATLEPKPGIPPTASHIMDVIETIKEHKISLIMVENFFEPSVTNRIKESIPTIRVAVVPVSVDGAPGINTLDDLYENLVSTIEGK
ncbi:metal ABC transporter substrate-binding protein [Bdellovibrionota bacterium FG-1]